MKNIKAEQEFKLPDCDKFDLRIDRSNLCTNEFIKTEFEGVFSLEYVNKLLECFGVEGELTYSEECKGKKPKISIYELNTIFQSSNKDYRFSFNRELNDNRFVITGFDIRRGFYIDGDYCTELVTTVNFRHD